MRELSIKIYMFFQFFKNITREYWLYLSLQFFIRTIAKFFCISIGNNTFIKIGVAIQFNVCLDQLFYLELR
jgi:hypothetical protein